MKIRIETIYENVTQEWLDWYIANGTMMPAEAKETFKKIGFTKYQSKDPSSDVVAVTTYEIIEEDDEDDFVDMDYDFDSQRELNKD